MKSESPTYAELKNLFSNRLLDLLTKNGYKTNRKPFFVDVAKFAKEISCSETMTRRYLSGMAMPSFQVIDNMADIFDVDPYWLYCGSNPRSPLNKDLLLTIMDKLRPLLNKSGSKDNFKDVLEYGCEIYEKVSQISCPDELEKRRLISWMIEELLNAQSLHSRVNQLLEREA